MAHQILWLAKTTRGSRNVRALSARRDYKLGSLAAFGRSLRENYCILRLTHLDDFILLKVRLILFKNMVAKTCWEYLVRPLTLPGPFQMVWNL